ncbi:MAG TPA: zinc ribbon domain-containing protein [Anaerolineales bacterium]|nr:zinc ribbon domain-containing protein [Anaerolineales bacterium]
MELGSILLILALAVLIVLYLARPLLDRQAMIPNEDDRRLSALQAERDQILATIHELDMDDTMGKLLPSDYQTQRAGLAQRGVAVLKQIDALGAEETLEAQVAFREGEASPEDREADLEAAVARMRLAQSQQVGGFCGQCGSSVTSGDRFCAACGASLLQEAGA